MQITAERNKDQCPNAPFMVMRLIYNGQKRFSLELYANDGGPLCMQSKTPALTLRKQC